MSFINEQTKEINLKIVYYGPPLGGKSTSLRQIHDMMQEGSKGELISLTSDKDRTLYFDFVPLNIGKIKDYTIRLHLYTVPGEMAYNAARKIISKGVDGVVFVADSQIEKIESNLLSLKELNEILKHEGTSLDDISYVIQYNKRDLPNAAPVEELKQFLNPRGVEDFESIAITGKGVIDTLQTAARKVLLNLRTEAAR